MKESTPTEPSSLMPASVSSTNIVNPQSVLEKPNMPHKKPLLRQMKTKSDTPLLVLGAVLVVLAGVGTGWFLSGGTSSKMENSDVSEKQDQAIVQSDTEAGMADTSTFEKEAPIGKLVKGGIDGEGQYHLERTGGVSQNVYLTSTVIDLASFEGKNVQVWGNTHSGKKAGWLMDVGKVKVVE